MMNEQLSWLTPFSQQVAPDLAWRSEYTKKTAADNSLYSAGICVYDGRAMIPSGPDHPSTVLDRKILAVDYGTRLTGIALYSPGPYAYPLPYLQLPYRSDDALLQDVARIVCEESAAVVVLGVPRLLDGTETTMSRRILAFGERLAQAIRPVPLYQQDESLSSFEAQERMKSSARYNFKIDPRQLDALAASIILEDFIKRLHPGVPDLPF